MENNRIIYSDTKIIGITFYDKSGNPSFNPCKNPIIIEKAKFINRRPSYYSRRVNQITKDLL